MGVFIALPGPSSPPLLTLGKSSPWSVTKRTARRAGRGWRGATGAARGGLGSERRGVGGRDRRDDEDDREQQGQERHAIGARAEALGDRARRTAAGTVGQQRVDAPLRS